MHFVTSAMPAQALYATNQLEFQDNHKGDHLKKGIIICDPAN